MIDAAAAEGDVQSRVPSPVPTVLQAPRESEGLFSVNFGPNHPSTHGVLRLSVDLEGEHVVGIESQIGYLHTGIEKTMETKSWWKAITFPARADYLAFQANEYAFVAAIEKLLDLEIPPKAVWMRMCLLELNRIHSHLVFFGTFALELGAISPYFYAFNARERVLDLFELVGGARMHTRYFQVGGLVEDIPDGFYEEASTFRPQMEKAVDEFEALLRDNAIWKLRTQDIGRLSASDAIALGQSGPVLRASGVQWDLRKQQPYLAYHQVDFSVPVYATGDVYARYQVRIDEMRQSARIVEQCLSHLRRLERDPWIADDRKVVLPPRHELHTSMESLIHHFKIVTEGYTVPEGEAYLAIESPRGEFGCYLASDGGPRPWRVKFRAPSFAALEAIATCSQGAVVADLIAIVGSLDTLIGEVDR